MNGLFTQSAAKENRSDNPVIPDGKAVDIYFKSDVTFERAGLDGPFSQIAKVACFGPEDPMAEERLARSLRYRPRG